jgi:hypothetical protein
MCVCVCVCVCVQGLEGEAGNVGLRGRSPIGVQGAQGVNGAQGMEGPKGGQGARGDGGQSGLPGARGDPGAPGTTGKAGRPAKRALLPKCGMTDTSNKNVCCGSARIDWQNFYGTGAYTDIDTNSCKFSGDDVMYFTEIFGQGGQWTKNGAQAIIPRQKADSGSTSTRPRCMAALLRHGK